MSRNKANIRLDDAVERYLERIRNEGQAERSIYTARYGLSRFRKAVAASNPRNPNPWIHQMTEADLDAYFFGPQGIRKNIGSVSFNRYRSVLKVFFDYAVIMRWTDTSPMNGIGRARPDTPKQRLYLNAGELLSLLDYCNNPVERIACAIGMNTGLRGNDIRHLTLFDASLASGVIQTEIRKTRKMDVKPMPLELHFELSKWLNTYAELTGLEGPGELPSDWLLVPAYRNAAPKGRATILPNPTKIHSCPWRMVQRPLERMGYPSKGEGFHTLRRSSARALFESLREKGDGRDHALMVVKEFLNHSTTAQTEHYLGLNQERVIRDALLKDKPFLSALAATEQARVNQTAPRELRAQHG